jgi:hypothetical protein
MTAPIPIDASKAVPAGTLTIIDAMLDPQLFEPSFRGETWANWRTILKAAKALPMTADEIAFFRSVAGDRDPPTKPVRELWIVAGRRSGKDSIASALACHAAAVFDQGHLLRPGERPLVALLACDRDQSQIVLGYIKSFFTDIPMLSAMITRTTAAGFALSNVIDISVATNSFRAVRGRPILCAILDEVAFYRSDTSATPDTETYKAIMPALATLPGSMLIGISSPYRKAGLLYQKYRDHFGKDSDTTLVVKAPTLTLNPTIDPDIVAQALQDDAAAARAEWLGEFRDDIGGYVDATIVEAAIDYGVTVRLPREAVVYRSFCDPSGGARDSFTAAIAHRESDGVAVLDALLEIKAPFNPTSATQQVTDLLKSYGLSNTVADKYGAGWIVDAFSKNQIRLQHSDRNRSEIYLDCMPLLTSGRCRLLDHRKLATQFASLERRTSPMGKDVVDHGPGGFDDLCNAAAGALVLAARGSGAVLCGPIIVSSGPRSFPGSDTFTGASGRVWERTIRGPT